MEPLTCYRLGHHLYIQAQIEAVFSGYGKVLHVNKAVRR